MAKKSMKAAAAAGTSVFDTIATGGVQNAKDAQNVADVKDVQNAKRRQTAKNAQGVKNTKDAKDAPEKIPQERLNLKIPADIKEYLYAAAYRESSPTKQVSVTEYLCQLVRADMKKHKDK